MHPESRSFPAGPNVAAQLLMHNLVRTSGLAGIAVAGALARPFGSVQIYGFPYIVVDGATPKQSVTFQYSDESDGVDHDDTTSTTAKARQPDTPGRTP